MSDSPKSLSSLSPQQRELLMRRLRERQSTPASIGNLLPTLVPDPAHRFDPFPLSEIQRAFWAGRTGLFDLGLTGSNAFLESLLIDSSGSFLQRLSQALNRLIARHDMLRAVMLSDGRQQVLPEAPFYPIALYDLRGSDGSSVQQELQRKRAEMCNHHGATDRWPLFDFVVFQLDGDRFQLFWRLDTLLMDGPTAGALGEELYRLCTQPDMPLAPIACTYRDYVLACDSFRQTEPYKRSQAYWMKRLADLPPAPSLPLAGPISPVMPTRFGHRFVPLLEPDAWAQLKHRAAQVGVTPSMLFTAAYAEIMARWSNCRHFTIGLIGTFRPPIHPDINLVAGNFNSLSPLVIDQTIPTFEARAKRLQRCFADDLEHRTFTGFQVARELNRMRKMTSRPALPIMFNFLLHAKWRPPEEERGSAGAIQELGASIYFSQVQLNPTLSERSDGGVNIDWMSANGAFPEGLLEEMSDAYARLVGRLATDEASWQESEFDLLSPSCVEARAAYQAPEAPVLPVTLHTLFEEQVARQPDRMALIAAHGTFTYRELQQRVHQVTAQLQKAGVQPGDLVAIALEKGWEQVAAVLGVLKAGAAYLPLNLSLPAHRLHEVLARGAVRVLLTHCTVNGRLQWPTQVTPILVERLPMDEGDEPAPILPEGGPEGLAYVLYQAESAEAIAGAMVQHRAVVNLILDINRRFAVGANDRVLAIAPLDSDLSLYDIVGTLAAGGVIVMPDPQTAADPAALTDLARRHSVTIWNSPPALLEAAVHALVGRPEAEIPSLRLALLSRGRVPRSLPDRLERLSPNVQVISLGGAPGVALWSSSGPVKRAEQQERFIDYGRPLANRLCYVFNEALQPCPDWVPGDLYVGGAGLVQGFCGAGGEGASPFVPHPETGAPLYRTGDRARFRPGGVLEWLGPPQRQVTVHGYPVQIDQIELVLEEHPALRAAIVLTHHDAHDVPLLVAYAVVHRTHEIAAGDLHTFLADRLPIYMVPAQIILLSELPLAPDGRVNDNALPLPAEAQDITTLDQAASRNAVERRLIQLWEEMLHVQAVDVYDHFFDLGGDSFALALMIRRVEEEFGCRLPLSALMAEVTIAHLTSLLRHR